MHVRVFVSMDCPYRRDSELVVGSQGFSTVLIVGLC